MATRSRLRPIAIALVLQDDDGSLQIIGSKSVNQFMFEATQEGDPFFSWGDTNCVPPRKSYHIEADCNSVIWQQGAPAPLPRQIEQRGIYLPDMSFRLLPSPEDT